MTPLPQLASGLFAREPPAWSRPDGGRRVPWSNPRSAGILLRMAKKRDIEKTYSRSEFVGKLRRLADAIESERAFPIQVAGERLRIPADAAFNIEHEFADGTHELEFQLRWDD